MKRKNFPTIVITIIILSIGLSCFLWIYHLWNSKDVYVSSPVITKIDKQDQTLDLKSIIYETEKNVMQIEAQFDDYTMTGSGFLFNEKGDIITNAHVIKDANLIYVRTSNARIYPAAIVGIGETEDIAVIRVPQLAGKNGLMIDRDQLAEIGDEVIALGSPHGFQNTVTLGIISGTDRNFSIDGYDYQNVYQISAQITHGNSGGPLINRLTGKVIGVNSVGTEDGLIGFSIPIQLVLEDIERWSNEAQNNQLEFANTLDIIHQQDPEQFKKDAEYVIDYYMESIFLRDYINAYALLGEKLQSKQSYSDFREQYVYIVDMDHSISSSKKTDNDYIQSTVHLSIETKKQNEDKVEQEKSNYMFTIGYENDQLKILKIATQ